MQTNAVLELVMFVFVSMRRFVCEMWMVVISGRHWETEVELGLEVESAGAFLPASVRLIVARGVLLDFGIVLREAVWMTSTQSSSESSTIAGFEAEPPAF